LIRIAWINYQKRKEKSGQHGFELGATNLKDYLKYEEH
jgi:hypothetical protein